ncbi:integrase family protein [Phyllobacterium sp. BT25]|uniref:Integrase family protein n=1 Tax=Phyllobacterium pellucidum TaxID=2740464 RepID=A0A849VP60_9HYPH|nr:integrase family protein [Phyllobacterium pellucidum]NTS29817.1 integrase family protein [Phyllobacterium pellucidum]
MPRKKLTAIMLDTLAPDEYYDSHCDGLIFRVQKRRKPWQTRYYDGTRHQRHTFGFFPSMSLKEARDACQAFHKNLEAGLPVAAESAPHPRSVNTETVGWLIDWYEEMRAKNPKGTKTLKKTMKDLRSCMRRFGNYLEMPAREFTKQHARDIRDKLDVKTPPQANRFLAYGSMCWSFAAQEDKVETNIFRDVRRLAGEEPRERVLSADEIAAVWMAAETMKHDNLKSRSDYGRMIQFLLLTAQRRGEVASLRYGDILDHVWFQQKNKADRPHKIKLSRQAMELVGQGDPRDFVFGTKHRFEKRAANICKLAKVDDWRVHDLRRSAATHLQELGVDETIVRAILNHAISGVSGVYLKAEYVAKKGEALQKWADEVDRIVQSNKASNIL